MFSKVTLSWPLLFAAALQPLAQELRRGPLDLAFFYLDDGGAGGRCGGRWGWVDAAAQLGLHLNLAKCEAVAVGIVSLDTLWAHFPPELLKAQDGTSCFLRNFELLGPCWRRSFHSQACGRPSSCSAGSHRRARRPSSRSPAPSLLRRSCAAHTQHALCIVGCSMPKLPGIRHPGVLQLWGPHRHPP